MKCKAKSKGSGKRCKKYAIPGGTVCVIHGGKAPQVMAAARKRIAFMVDPALEELEKLLTCEHKNVSLGAIKVVLDRAGLKPTDKVKFEGDIEVNDPGREKLSDEQLDRLIALLSADTESDSIVSHS